MYINHIFEFYLNISNSNKIKHGIDFIEAQKIWDNSFLEIPILGIDFEEKRNLCIGIVNNKYYSAIITYRGENIRIISIRRSRNEEKKLYEEYSNDKSGF